MNPPAKSQPAPIFDATTAKPVTPYRHESTGRTVAFHQPADKQAHLFTATGIFVATIPAGEAEAHAKKIEAETKAARAKEKAEYDAEHARRMKLAAMTPEEREAALKAERDSAK